VHIVTKLVFSFVLVLLFNSEVYSECLPQEESYKKYVEKTSLAQEYKENETSIKLLKKHLECHPDKEVFHKLAVIYEYSGKYYLAGLAYKNAGKNDEYARIEKIRTQKISSKKKIFELLANNRQKRLLTRYKTRRGFELALFIGGSVISATGLALFIHDKAGGENSLGAQYGLMFGGITLIGAGLFLDPWTYKTLKTSKWYENSHQQLIITEETLVDKREIYGNADKAASKLSYKRFRNTGIGLLILSIPLTALTIYGFFDSYNVYLKDKEEKKENHSEDEKMFEDFGGVMVIHILQLFSFIPAILSITGGTILLVKSSEYKNLKTDAPTVTLNNISPMINPITKTYGISMGFSF